MSKRPSERTRIFFKDEELKLDCEWEGCTSNTYYSIDTFLYHITSHVNELSPNFTECLWQDCSFNESNVDVCERSDLLRHVLYHGFHSKIKCYGSNLLARDAQCGKCALDPTSRNIIPDLPHSLQCGWDGCQEVLDNPEYFYRHVNAHVEDYKDIKRKKRQLVCKWQGCPSKSFIEMEKLRAHLRSHSQEKQVACPTCGALFSNRTKFHDHIYRQKSTVNAGYQCSCCSKYFVSERLLKSHMRTHIYRFNCLLCDFTSPSRWNLNKHIKYKHSNERDYQCQFCTHRSKTLTDLKRHEDLHSNSKLFVCTEEECTFKAKTYQNLVAHFRRMHLAKESGGYVCHVCGMLYSRGNYLTKHLASKHDIKASDGQSRLRYKQCDDGLHRLVSVHYDVTVPSNSETDENNGDELNLNVEPQHVQMTATAKLQIRNDDTDCDDPKSAVHVESPVLYVVTSDETGPTNSVILEVKRPDGSTVVCACPIQYGARADLCSSTVIAEGPTIDATLTT